MTKKQKASATSNCQGLFERRCPLYLPISGQDSESPFLWIRTNGFQSPTHLHQPKAAGGGGKDTGLREISRFEFYICLCKLV